MMSPFRFLRGTSERDLRLALSLYLATLILGAGVFLLPLEAARVGLVPLLVMLGVILWPCIRLYERSAGLMIRRDGGVAGGGEALGRPVVEAGGGRAGAVLALQGIAVYVVGAAIIYNLLALPSLELLAAQLGGSVAAGATVAVVAVVGLLLVRRVPKRNDVARRLLTVTSFWSLATPVMALLAAWPWAEKGAGLIVFVIGCLLVSRAPVPAERAERAPYQLSSSHNSSITGLSVQLSLMLLIVVAAIALVALPGGFTMHWNAWKPADDFHPSALLGAGAVILFAHVGTGLSNVSDYPAMASATFRRSVVRKSLYIVTAVLVVWLVPTAFVFGHEGLASLVTDKTNTALGLPSAVAAAGGTANGVLSVVVAFVTLIAVTNANAGFVTSLARELIGCAEEVLPGTSALPSEWTLKVGLIAVLAAASGGAIMVDDAFTPMLHIAGIVGGGIIVFALPLLAEDGTLARRVRCGAGAVVVTAGLGVWATGAALTESGTDSVAVKAVMIAIGWAPLIPAFLAARGVVRGAEAMPAQLLALRNQARRQPVSRPGIALTSSERARGRR